MSDTRELYDPEPERGLAISKRAIPALQELEVRFATAVRQRELLEGYIKAHLHAGRHFYKIEGEGNRKPSLTKEGAELVCLPHGLKAHYDILAGPDDPPRDNSAYQITVRCELGRGESFEGQGLGSASSWHTRRDGTYKPRQNDPGLCHNATLKMASKSAFIAATLNATAASEFFTQDLEDIAETLTEAPTPAGGHYCPVHKTPFFKTAKMKGFAHPIGDTGKWCNEADPASPTTPKNPKGVKTPSTKSDPWGDVFEEAPEASEPPESPSETAPGSTPAEVIHHPDASKATGPQKRGSTGSETAQDIADLRVLVKEALAERWPNDRERRNEAAFCRAFGMVSTVEEIPPHMLREALEMAPGPKGRTPLTQ